MEGKIIHVDMDAFFASVEQRDNPSLQGKPVIVGGQSNRGIVTTCSYEARKYGIHSAMPIFKAKERCPHGIYVPVRLARYKEISAQVFEILTSITDKVEPLSIDEAYLDVSSIGQAPKKLAQYIKKRVMEETGLTLSIGISYNKFLAKLASDWNKPDGLKIITPDMVPEILKPLSISKVYGIGKKTAKKLNTIGIFYIRDLMNLSQEYLIELLGKTGMEVYHMIRGVDNREVEVGREVKSIGRESTLERDTRDRETLDRLLLGFARDIANSLDKRNLSGRTVTIKIRERDFTNRTRSRTYDCSLQSAQELYQSAIEILDELAIDEDLRLIGLSLSNLDHRGMEQLDFFDLLTY